MLIRVAIYISFFPINVIIFRQGRCIHGICYEPQCNAHVDCPLFQICQNRQCVPEKVVKTCNSFDQCPKGKMCSYGFCITNRCINNLNSSQRAIFSGPGTPTFKFNSCSAKNTQQHFTFFSVENTVLSHWARILYLDFYACVISRIFLKTFML